MCDIPDAPLVEWVVDGGCGEGGGQDGEEHVEDGQQQGSGILYAGRTCRPHRETLYHIDK